jgi:hydroxymethylbilane synthase
LRGNVETRIAKVLERRELDAAVLACAGLERLGLQDAITEVLQPDVMLPAPGQGALAIQCRADDDDLLELLAAIDHGETRAEVTAERALLQGLGGGCSAPIGALVSSVADRVGIWCGVFGPPGMKSVTMARAMNDAKPPFDLDRMVAQMLDRLREGGADEILGYYR